MNIVHPQIRFKNPLIALDLNNITAIILHHIQAKVATAETINEWHIANGWSGIGYNEYIRKDGTVYICRGDYVGSHCQGQNSKTYGIAVEGDYDTESIMPNEQKRSLVERIKYNRARFKNLIGVFPHNYFNDTKCPGKNFPIQEILAQIENRKEPVKLFTEVKEAIQFLIDRGSMNNPLYWKKAIDVVYNLDDLIIKWANDIVELELKLGQK